MRLLLAGALILACSSPRAEEGRAAPPAGDQTMYLTDSFNGSGLIAIDPLTLKDASLRPLLSIGWTASNSSWTAASADGRTLAVVAYRGGSPTGEDVDISVYDARSGDLRVRFHPEVPVIVDELSADGTRIRARPWPPGGVGGARVILDATTGRVLDREAPIAFAGDVVALAQDDEARRLYAVVVATDPNASGPRSVDIGAWDLRTGAEIWRLPLPKVSAGRWRTGRTFQGQPVFGELVPGFALSADERQLAVVQTPTTAAWLASGMVWTVDAATGGVTSEWTFQLDRSLIERLFAVSVAAAKSPDEGVKLSARFSPDGRLLYAWGAQTRVDGRGDVTEQYLGMVSIRMSDGTVSGTDIKMERGWYDDRMSWVRPSPDGRWLYLFLERTGEYADPKGYVLRRVDAVTLRVLAERRSDRYLQAFVLARP